MMKPTLAGLGLIAALVFAPMAAADKLNDRDSTARTEMNALGDKALAGDEAALWTLKATANECRATRPCPAYSLDTSRAAAAAANLGWLYWTKGAFGAEQKAEGMRFYAQAARLGAPSGLFQVADCLRDQCLPADQQAAAFSELYPGTEPKPWNGDKYTRLKAASALFGQAARNGLTAAAVEKAGLENELVGLARGFQADWDDGTLAIYGHLNEIITIATRGLETNPDDTQRQALQTALANARTQAQQFGAEAEAARQRKQAPQTPAVTSSSTAPEPVSKGANYAADKARARSCITESRDLKDWRRDLDDWARDMKKWDAELKETRRDLELYYRNDTALRNSYNADVDVFNAEGREYDAEQRRYNDAADAYNGRCKGSFNSYAIKEECTGSAEDTRFCRSFR